ncbi:MAG: glutamate ligase domain-containing protein, partial [Calditrichia bacterium]
VTVGRSDKYDVWGTEESVDQLGCIKFILNGTTAIQLKIPGSHQFGNALLAAAVALVSGVASGEVKEVLENFTAVKQRMEIFERRGILIVNDAYNANPDSMRAAIDYLISLPGRKGKKILVLGDMLELGDFAEREHEAIGRYIAGKPVDFVFLYGPLSPFVGRGLQKNNSGDIQAFSYETHEEIARHLDKILAPGDVILLKGSRGMMMETILQKLTILEGK